MIISIDSLREVDWAPEYLWSIKIPGIGAPFDQWHPVESVTYPIAGVQLKDVQLYNNVIGIPIGPVKRECRIQFKDNVDGVMEEFFAKWMRASSGGLTGVVPALNTVVKLIQIQKLNRDKTVNREDALWVIPIGVLEWSGSGSSESRTQGINLQVVG